MNLKRKMYYLLDANGTPVFEGRVIDLWDYLDEIPGARIVSADQYNEQHDRRKQLGDRND